MAGRSMTEKYLPAMIIAALIGALCGILESVTVMRLNPLEQSAIEKLFFFFSTLLIYSIVLMISGTMLNFILQKFGLSPIRSNVLSGFLPGCILLAGVLFSLHDFRAEKQVSLSARPAGNPEGTNVLLISIDTLRADHLGCYGNDRIVTPRIDRIAREGALFLNAYCQIPATNPSHASVMTGLYPFSHGSRFNGIPLEPHVKTLAHILKGRGYETAAFISCSAMEKSISGLQKGFDIYNQDLFPLPFNQQVYHLLPAKLARKCGWISSAERKAERVNECIMPWLDMRGQGPFFLWAHYFDPHTLYDPPSPYDHMYTGRMQSDKKFDIAFLKKIGENNAELSKEDVAFYRAKYSGEISYTDYYVGELLHALEARELDRNTLVILCADHGESLGEHEYYFFHGKYLYEPSLRVPLLFKFPGVIPAGQTIERMVRLIDVTPTVLALLDMEPPVEMQGQNLAPLFLDQSLPVAPSFGENAARFYYRPDQKISPNYEDKLYSIRTENWKYIERHGGGDRELYNLMEDQGEMRNLTARHPQMADDLSLELEKYLARMRSEAGNGQEGLEFDRDLFRRLEILGYIEKRN